MEQAYFNASQFQNWLKRIHIEKNREQQSDLYSQLSSHLATIFSNWCTVPLAEVLYKVIEILSPCVADNLFAAVMRKESLNYMHSFPFTMLPGYVQRILMTRKLELLPEFYKSYEIVLDKGFIVLPTPQYFLFTFMAESGKIRGCEWFENPSFLEEMYKNPFLLLFNQYLQCLDSELFTFLCVLGEEYLIKDIANKAGPAPHRHNCEMLLLMVYVLQRPAHLLVPNYRMININERSLLISFHDSLYKYFKNLAVAWQEGPNSYCCYIGEIWLQYLTPWKNSQILDSYLNNETFPMVPNYKPGQKFDGTEQVWEEYINLNILFYTDLFNWIFRLLCSEILFRPGDIYLLLRISEAFAEDSQGFLFNSHLNLRSLHGLSKSARIPQELEQILLRNGTNRSSLFPFNDSTLQGIIETLVFKAASLGFHEVQEIKQNFNQLIGIRDVKVLENSQSQLRTRRGFSRSLINPWDKPLRSDEFWLLYMLSKYLAWGFDKLCNQESWPPRSNFRFFASASNLLFIFLIGFIISYLLF